MLETKTLTTLVKSRPSDLTPTLISLSEAGWKPAIMESERVFLQWAGVADKMDLQTLRQPTSAARRRLSVAGDIIFKESDVYYIVANPGETWMEVGGRRFAITRDSERKEPSLEIGIVSSESKGIDERLGAFAEAVERALRATSDSEESDSLSLEWQELKPGTPHLDSITDIDPEESGTKFARASLAPECVQAARVLSYRANRDLLIELLQAAFAREQDLLNRRSRRQKQIKEALDALRTGGLIQTEFLLECKQTRTPLTRLVDRKQIEELAVADLICPSCGSRFSDEVLSEGYSVSDLGRSMAQQSHWMTVWTTELLTKLGIPEDAILWNISENGEEVDLLVEFLGHLWIFELKDREFGAGDAHPLNYRQVRYRATRAIIFTTEQVSKDAKRVFKELQREAMRSRIAERSRQPLYIEGLEKAEDILRREIAGVSLTYARRRLAMIGESSGYNLGAVLSARFGEPIGVQIEEEDIPF